MSDTTTITPEKLVELRKHAAEYCEEDLCCHIKPETVLGLLDALERAESRADGGLMEELKRATAIIEKKEARVKLLEKELDGADSEIASLKDELEDSRGTEKDAPHVLCAISRLVGVYEHCQELGDDMGTMSLEAVQDLIADKQKAEANVARLTKERDWLAMNLSGYDNSKKCTVYAADWKEAASRAVAAGEEPCQR